MANKVVKHASFWYVNKNGVNETALRGDTVDITNEDDIERGERLGAFATDADLEADSTFAALVTARRANQKAAADAGIPALIERPAAPPADPPVERPGNNDSRDKWVAYAKDKGAPDDELVALDQGGLSRDRLREKYGA